MRIKIYGYWIFLIGTIPQLMGQDTHYWTNQYGARAALLGGAVIAGSDDNSAVYYNPANLAFIQESTVSLNTSVYRYSDLYWGNGAGTDVNLHSQRISLYQQMISGLLTKHPEQRHRIGFNILTRQHVNIDMAQRHEGQYELSTAQDGLESYMGSVELNNNITETWGCLGVGYRLSDHFSIGLTGVVTYRSQRYAYFYTTRAVRGDSLAVNGSVPLNVGTNAYDIHTRSSIIGGLLKWGLHARFGRWYFGLNGATPSVTFWGESRVLREDSQFNLPGNRDQIRTGEQRVLPTQYRYPWTLGFGLAYRYPSGGIYHSWEFFGAVPQYEMITSDPDQFTSTALFSQLPNNFFTVYHGANRVLNFALGWEQRLYDKLYLHLGLRSDFSHDRGANRTRIGDINLQSIPIHLWHGSFGISLRRKASFMSIGLNYTYGHRGSNFLQLINFTDPVVQSPLFLEGERTRRTFVNYHAVTLLIGYTYFFALK